MVKAIDCAKFIMQNCPSVRVNSFDGSMKLQNILLFANLISLARTDNILFDETIFALAHGCIIEDVRLRYKNDFDLLVKESLSFKPQFTQEEYDVLNIALDIYGDVSARELSKINRDFDFWKNNYIRYCKANAINKYENKDFSKVSKSDMLEEIYRIKEMLVAHEHVKKQNFSRETINGVTFYYRTNELKMDDKMIDELYSFSEDANDDSYTVSMQSGDLVIW